MRASGGKGEGAAVSTTCGERVRHKGMESTTQKHLFLSFLTAHRSMRLAALSGVGSLLYVGS
jgi:hypothetical protein